MNIKTKPNKLFCLFLFFTALSLDSRSFTNDDQSRGFKVGSPVFLFVHGLFGNGLKSWGKVIRSLPQQRPGYRYGGDLKATSKSRFIDARADFFTLTFSSSKSLTFEQQGEELGQTIGQISEKIKRPIILIGSSMGGLAIRAFLANHGTAGIAGVVTINTPHVGSILGLLKHYSDQLQLKSRKVSALTMNPLAHDLVWEYNRALAWRITGLDLQAPAVQYLNPGSSEIRELAAKGIPKDIPYACIMSDWQDESGIKAKALRVIREFLQATSSLEGTPYGAASDAVHENWGDGIVSLWSQDIKSIGAGAEGIRLFRKIVDDPSYTFHTDSNENVPAILQAIDWILAQRNEIASEHFSRRPDASRIGHSGELKITLQWNGNADLDLHVDDPCGARTFYKNPKTICAENEGTLDVDANANCTRNMSLEPAENIYWLRSSPGQYKILVHGYSLCNGRAPIAFTVTVFNKQKRSTFRGQIDQVGQFVEAALVNVE